MTDSKLVELLRTLTARETTRFAEYVHSPYFNKHQQLTSLCDYLLKFAPRYQDEQKLSKEYIFAYLCPKEPYNDATMHSIFSKLLRLLYDFLIDDNWQEDKRPREIILLRQLRQRKVDEKHTSSAIRRFPTLDTTYQKQRALLYWEDYLFYKELDMLFLSQGGRTSNDNLQQENNALDLAFIAEKLRIACDMASRNIVAKAQYEITAMDLLETYLQQPEQRALLELPVVAIYNCILQTIRFPDEIAHYQQLKKLLHTHHVLFCVDEAMDMYGYALNYCIQKINKGKPEFYEEVLGLYQLLVDKKIIYINNYLPAWEYKNIVTAAIRLGRYEWAKRFVETYYNDLAPSTRENAYRYNLATIYYGDKDYKKALQSLHDVEFTDTTYHLGAKIIQLKSYYELNEGEALRSLVDAFQVYVRRNKEISDYRKDANVNFVRLTKKIYNLKEQKTMLETEKYQARFTSLVQELERTNPLANKDWLQQIIQQLAIL